MSSMGELPEEGEHVSHALRFSAEAAEQGSAHARQPLTALVGTRRW